MAIVRKAVELAAESQVELLFDTMSNGGGAINLGYMVLSYLFGGIESELRPDASDQNVGQLCSWGVVPLNEDFKNLTSGIMDLMECFRAGVDQEPADFSTCALDLGNDAAMRAVGERLKIDDRFVGRTE